MTTTLTVTTLIAVFPVAAVASTVADAKREIRRLWGDRASTMECVVRFESGWNPRAVSRTGDHGLSQLNAYTWRRHFGQRWALVYDPVANIRMAYEVYVRAGRSFRPWVAYRYCR